MEKEMAKKKGFVINIESLVIGTAQLPPGKQLLTPTAPCAVRISWLQGTVGGVVTKCYFNDVDENAPTFDMTVAANTLTVNGACTNWSSGSSIVATLVNVDGTAFSSQSSVALTAGTNRWSLQLSRPSAPPAPGSYAAEVCVAVNPAMPSTQTPPLHSGIIQVQF
jgi:hypothetical protein